MKNFRIILCVILSILLLVSCKNQKVEDNTTENTTTETTSNVIWNDTDTETTASTIGTTSATTEPDEPDEPVTTTTVIETDPVTVTTTVTTTEPVITEPPATETTTEYETTIMYDEHFVFGLDTEANTTAPWEVDHTSPDYSPSSIFYEWENQKYKDYPPEEPAENPNYYYLNVSLDEGEELIGMAVFATADKNNYRYTTGQIVKTTTEEIGTGEKIWAADGYEVMYMSDNFSIDLSDRLVMPSNFKIYSDDVANNIAYRFESFYICKDSLDLYYFIDALVEGPDGSVYIKTLRESFKGSEISIISLGLKGTNEINGETFGFIPCLRVRPMDKKFTPHMSWAYDMYRSLSGMVSAGGGYGVFNAFHDIFGNPYEFTILDIASFTLQFSLSEDMFLLNYYEDPDMEFFRAAFVSDDGEYCHNVYCPFTIKYGDPYAGLDD